eukprot:55853_1
MSSLTIILTAIIILIDLINIASAAAIGRLLGKCCGCFESTDKAKPRPHKPPKPVLIQIESTSVEIRSQVLTVVGEGTTPLTFASESRRSNFGSSRFAQSSYRSPLSPLNPLMNVELQCYDIIDSLPVEQAETNALISECRQRLIHLSNSVVEKKSNKFLLILNLKDTVTYNHSLHKRTHGLSDAWDQCVLANERGGDDLIMTAHALSANDIQVTGYRRHLLTLLWNIRGSFDIAVYDDHSDDQRNTFHQAIAIETYFNIFRNAEPTKSPFRFKFVRTCSVNETKSMQSLCCKHDLSPYIRQYQRIFIADDIVGKWTKDERDLEDRVSWLQAKSSREVYSTNSSNRYLSDEGLLNLQSYLLHPTNHLTEIERRCRTILSSLFNDKFLSRSAECQKRLRDLTRSVVENPSKKRLLIVNLKETLTYSHSVNQSVSIIDACKACGEANRREDDLVATAQASPNGVQVISYRKDLLTFIRILHQYFDFAIYDDYSDDEWDTFEQAIAIEQYLNAMNAKRPFRFKFVQKCSVNETKSMAALCRVPGVEEYLEQYRNAFAQYHHSPVLMLDELRKRPSRTGGFNFVQWINVNPKSEQYTCPFLTLNTVEFRQHVIDDELTKLQMQLIDYFNAGKENSDNSAFVF